MAYNKYFVYSLSDPFDLKIKYIGYTKDLGKRYSHHKSNSKTGKFIHNQELSSWVSYLISMGTRPIIKSIIECESRDKAKSIEKMLIRKLGSDLFNILNNNSK